ncbi:MAG: ERF family protein [Desulfovibrio sp.]|uniref:ERF family protein n=1 Tax=Desulfovibrio sp. TaxID=885 RepID=UPI001A7D98D7|nr:ERF family protein [Desulfovibrio sp.]MBD5416537.1 ERF family protein [Desulfovibrio sp.]
MDTYCSENITELAQALINVQKLMTPAAKDGKNPFTKSNYATLNSVMESCRDILLDQGIWLTQLPVPAPSELGQGYLGLLTKLTHAKTGQWQASLAVIPLPKSDPQGMGSAITYARRYALTSMLGMITEDDDAESAKEPKMSSAWARTQRANYSQEPRQSRRQPISAEPVRQGDDFGSLPKLEGVSYQYVTAQDGRQCIIATGNTLAKKELLSGAGFRWHAQRKYWWKYAEAA